MESSNQEMNHSLDVLIEALLFYRGNAIKYTELEKQFSVSSEDLQAALTTLTARLHGGATQLIMTDDTVQLMTAPALDGFIESIRRDELKRDIGKAGAETLAIILYKGPIHRAEIDRIRGVNSAFIIRNLLMRGLIERTVEGNAHKFSITPALLAHLGISHKTELPDYQTVLDQLEQFEAEQQETQEQE